MRKLLITLLLLNACASQKFRLPYEHFDRNKDVRFLLVFVGQTYTALFYDDITTTYPFDEGFWLDGNDSSLDYFDIVGEGGVVNRYFYHLGERKFKFLKEMEANAFAYWYIINNEKRIPTK